MNYNLPIKPQEASVIELFFESGHGLQKVERIAQSRNALQLLSDVLTRINEAQLASRMCLGRILGIVREENLYIAFDGFNVPTFGRFMRERLPTLFGISSRVGYESIEMASSATLAALPLDELKQIPIINAKTLVRAEKIEKPTPEVVANAKTMPTADFRASVGVSVGVMVQKWMKDEEAAPHVKRILNTVAMMTPHAAKNFADFLESPELAQRAGDGADNRFDCLLATVELAWQNEPQAIFETEAELEEALTELKDLLPPGIIEEQPAPMPNKVREDHRENGQAQEG